MGRVKVVFVLEVPDKTKFGILLRLRGFIETVFGFRVRKIQVVMPNEEDRRRKVF